MALRIALGQFNACLGDIAGNVEAMRKLMCASAELSVDVLVLPEMCICGYPPEDLLLKKHFIEDNYRAVEKLAAECTKMTVIAGFAGSDETGNCYNSLAVLADGFVKHIYRKCVLPNYGVFDEQRYFQPGTKAVVIDVKGIALVLTICEDIWQFGRLDDFLKDVPAKNVIVNISASPFYMGKINERQRIFSLCAKHFNCALAYCNLIGGQDELVFDGRSMFVDSSGKVVSRARAFAEDLLVADIVLSENDDVRIENVKATGENPAMQPVDPMSEVYESLVLGTRDYVLKNGFAKVIVALSGGVDSALTVAIAVDALGKGNVVGVTMPSKFNSPETITDAEKLAANLGIEFHTIPIGVGSEGGGGGILEKFNETLALTAGWDDKGVAYENLQARIRGCILMSLSNQFNYMVLTTGNKSEVAVGYSTLYGDTAGGFAVIKDVPKTMVYRLSEYVNKVHNREIIPPAVIARAPSAELKPDQKDSDSLPSYEKLDRILKGYIEADKSAQTLIAEGLDADLVKRIITLVDRNEYKRRQSPPGVKITPKAFGKDRRMPITNRYTST